jgi:hypothetical protein
MRQREHRPLRIQPGRDLIREIRRVARGHHLQRARLQQAGGQQPLQLSGAQEAGVGATFQYRPRHRRITFEHQQRADLPG